VSNGSLWTAPDLPGRLRALRARGGRLVVVDPVRTRTADAADRHVPIRPGTDVLLLAALVHEVLVAGPADLGSAAPYVDPGDVERVRVAVAAFPAERVAGPTGVPAGTVRRLATELRDAPTAAVYGRLGTTTAGLASPEGALHAFGTATSWLIDVLNVVTGNLDRPGGVLWALPAVGNATTRGAPGRGRGLRLGRRSTRARGRPGVLGELPAVALAEEIDTPSADGSRLRALLTVAGNPVLTVPGGPRLSRALAGLDAMVSVDAYLNETTRHAHVVLPAPSPLTRPHHDPAFATFSVRNVVRYDEPVLPPEPGERSEADTLLALAALGTALASGGPVPDVDTADDAVAGLLAARLVADEGSRAHGRDPAQLLAAVAPRRREARVMDLLLRAGPYGDGFGAEPDGLTLEEVLANPSGVDLGPLRPRLPEVLRTPTGRIELAPEVLLGELVRAAAVLDELVSSQAPHPRVPPGTLLLVGRRQVRSNNSWMHNLPSLAGGSTRCTVLVHPADAAERGLADGQPVLVRPAGNGAPDAAAVADLVVEISDRVAPGVVSVPHGWGHRDPAVRLGVAVADPGSNVNAVTPDVVDPLAATAVLNGVPVLVDPVPA
jgi:anaerobic selenocysteine-containing dehydrogenase